MLQRLLPLLSLQMGSVVWSIPSCTSRTYAAAGASMSLVKDLREKSGAPISDVKSALVEANWDPESAYQNLRKKGLAAASKKASRLAAEGLVGIATAQHKAAMVEVNSETDFVAKNERFRALVKSIAHTALDADLPTASGTNEINIDDLASQCTPSGLSASDAVAEVAGSVRENIKLRRGFRVESEAGLIASYVHTSPAPSLGRMAALVALETSSSSLTSEQQSEAKEIGQKVAMHAVAMKPRYLSPETVPAEALEAEKQVLRDQAKSEGSKGKPKPANIIEKIISGRINKFYEDSCLVKQKFVMADDQSVQEYVKIAGLQMGIDLQVGSFARMQVGEGLEKAEKDFAAEVADTIRSAA
ncbi:hypothetical protein ABBQ38_011256 [Trebouxia sp. C0009 RCD-2024]